MDDKKDIKKELEEIAPFLSSLDKKEAYEVPSNYFKQLPDEIMKQLEPSKSFQAQAPRLSLWDQFIALLQQAFQPKFALAMASVVLAIGSFFYLNQEANPFTDHIASEEYLAYVEANLEDFEEEMIFELSQNDDFELDVFSDVPIEDQALEEYLDEFIDDLEDQSLEDFL